MAGPDLHSQSIPDQDTRQGLVKRQMKLRRPRAIADIDKLNNISNSLPLQTTNASSLAQVLLRLCSEAPDVGGATSLKSGHLNLDS